VGGALPSGCVEVERSAGRQCFQPRRGVHQVAVGSDAAAQGIQRQRTRQQRGALRHMACGQGVKRGRGFLQ